ncbi:MAG: type II toxin-antitoxin system VapC family toxin [Polyangia bacterium]|jgi:ribonuclease VapC|nr:type II toxin-antitoxin system VapC family toxin [Polyangia bacterium]
MVVDTSALLAILFQEPDALAFASAIEQDSRRLLSAGSLLETSIVTLARFGEPGERELDLMLHRAGIQIVPFGGEQVQYARHAYCVYGKGRHPAALNFGDCFSYALSKSSREPLLFKGVDFGKTDVLVWRSSSEGRE